MKWIYLFFQLGRAVTSPSNQHKRTFHVSRRRPTQLNIWGATYWISMLTKVNLCATVANFWFCFAPTREIQRSEHQLLHRDWMRQFFMAQPFLYLWHDPYNYLSYNVACVARAKWKKKPNEAGGGGSIASPPPASSINFYSLVPIYTRPGCV